MPFNTIQFIFLLLIVVFATYTLRRSGSLPPQYFLIFASFGFYAIWNISDLPVLLISLVFNFFFAQAIFHAKARLRLILTSVGILTNLGLLSWFKIGPGAAHGLPLGLSFFTFQQIAYLVSVYKSGAPASVANYAFVICFFPHMVAGPLVQHGDMIAQLNSPRVFRFKRANLFAGSSLFIIGLAKKVLLADTLGLYAGNAFHLADSGVPLDCLTAWTGAIAGFLNVYFDFSGYSDMACGIALMVGIKLPMNFYSPYKAASLDDFWHRWHITLTQFFRTHLFRPLAGKRLVIRRHLAVLPFTMIAAGMWHSPSWNFFAWGLFHGVLVTIQHGFRLYLRTTPVHRKKWAHKLLGWAETQFILILLGCFFQAKTLNGTFGMVTAMAGFSAAPRAIELPSPVSPTILEATSMFLPQLQFEAGYRTDVVVAVATIAICWSICLFTPNSTQLLANFRPVNDSTNLLRKRQFRRTGPVLFRGRAFAAPRISWIACMGLIFGLSLIKILLDAGLPFNYFNF
ncbi:MBOAT family protein [Phyllobacterium sp. SYP-B3895]|uniref:MBOAT family O-acyltransferase n=1 Tax=Phyllobacterium sp. SYP-B3895 TaxID=2663240 RepID=UPI00156231F3|nr:MBOAT family protein [Phyllobacterium sp. SYP-B3895]